MAPLLSVELVGDNQLVKNVEKAVDELRFLEAKKKAADLVIKRAAQLAPKHTGALSQSLHTDADGHMFSDVPYGNPIHWGWAARGIRENMFLLEAGRQTESQWIKFFEDEVWDAIANISGK